MEAKLYVVLSIQGGVNHGFMVRPNVIYKTKTKENGVISDVYLRSKLLIKLERACFKLDFIAKRLLSRFY